MRCTASHCILMTTVPSGVKKIIRVFNLLIKSLQDCWKITCFSTNAFKPILDKPIASSTIPLSLSNLPVRISWEEMSALLTTPFVSKPNLFSFQNQSEFTEWLPQHDQKRFKSGLKKESSWKNKYISLYLRNLLFNCSKLWEKPFKKQPCHYVPLI